jgi:Carboxypeptidase regulatory-like domain/Polysaccharide lyase family 4, domain II
MAAAVTKPLAVFALGCAIGFSQPPGPPPEPANWTVTGTVLDSVTGQPVAGALVIWEASFAAYGFRDRPADSTGPTANAARIVTPASGQFTFSADASATGVRLFISHQGYRAQDGKETANISVAAGPSQNLSFRLVPQSTIEGHVFNSSDEPLAGIEVHAVRIDIHDGLRRPREDVSKVTGKSGEFRFDGLPAGVYYLRSSGRYYASSNNQAVTQDRAQLLPLTSGQTVTADFHLDPHTLYQIRGIITNMPLRRTVEMRLLRGGDPLSNPFLMTPNGTFQIRDVEPGTYTLQAYTPGVVPPDFGEAEVTVGEGDVAALKLSLSEGMDISGHIEFHGSGSVENYAVVHATPFYPRRLPVDYSEIVATMRPNGNFVLKNMLPGKYEITVRGAPDTYLAEATVDAKDILDRGLIVSDKESPPLTMAMRSGGSEIAGDIESEGLERAFTVALIARYGDVEVPTIVRTLDGHFHATGLIPGDYTLLAWPESREIEYRNPAVLSDLAIYKLSVSIVDGGRRNVSLTPVP